MKSHAKDLLRRFRISKDGRVVASNFGYLILLQIAGYIFPLITIPYLARVIGVEGFGKIAFAAAVILWFQTVADWGFNYTATIDVARNRSDLGKVSEIFSNVLWARIFLMMVSFVLLCLLIATVPYFNENKDILLVSFLLIPGHIMFPDWFFQAMERMRFITFFNLFIKALFTILVFVFVTDKAHYFVPPLLTALGYLIAGAVAMYIILAKWGVQVGRPKIRNVFRTISASTDVFINNISRNLYNAFSVVLLGFMGGSAANGILDAGRRFVGLSQNLANIIDRVFFPFLSRRIEFHSRYAVATLMVITLGVVFLILLAPHLIGFFYTDEFLPAAPLLQFMAISIVFTSMNSIYGTNFLVLKGKERLMRNITLCVSMAGFVTAFPLIHLYGYWGAAVNIVAAQAVLGFTMWIFARRVAASAC